MFKGRAVGLDPFQKNRRDREVDARRVEPAPREHMVQQPTMDASIAVLERVDEHEAEGEA